jgi:NAD(P)-dependent dehydrogenase (short-subunit alcohol dehydrogenase family)
MDTPPRDTANPRATFVVLGAAGGVGSALLRRLAKSGAALVAGDANSVELGRVSPGNVKLSPLSSTQPTPLR